MKPHKKLEKFYTDGKFDLSKVDPEVVELMNEHSALLSVKLDKKGKKRKAEVEERLDQLLDVKRIEITQEQKTSIRDKIRKAANAK